MFTDFIINDDGQVGFGDATEHVVNTHFFSRKGQNKFYPLIGIGLRNFQDARNLTTANLTRVINQSLQNDGISPNQFNSVISKNANRISIDLNTDGNSS